MNVDKVYDITRAGDQSSCASVILDVSDRVEVLMLRSCWFKADKMEPVEFAKHQPFIRWVVVERTGPTVLACPCNARPRWLPFSPLLY